MRIYIQTLGCKVNQYESQAVAAMLREKGWEIADEPEGCDVIMVNTCAVTAEAVRKSRQTIRNLQKRAPGAKTAICGCWPQTEPEAARELGAEIVFGSGEKHRLAEAIASGAGEDNVDRAFSRKSFEPLPSGSAEGRTRALLKIEDGCTNFCAYCVIPYARGAVRSLGVDDAVAEAKKLAAEGYREIVITGIEIASYGRDLDGKPTLADVCEEILKATGDIRLRLGSLEPRVVTREFCERLSRYPGLCPQFHLSLQSGSDETLRRMRRKYDTARFYESVQLLREYFPNCGITADLITGFPGETEEEFSETLRFMEKCRFSQTHVFPYSRRAGTPAAEMEGQVPRAVKEERAHEAARLAGRLKREFAAAQVGKTLSVLFETEEAPGLWQGHSGNYLLVTAEGTGLKNEVRDVYITAAEGERLIGRL